mgnify:CR=1 FL=1
MRVGISRLERRDLELCRMICTVVLALGFFNAENEGVAQGLPDTVTGKGQVYDGVTFDLMQDGGRYRTTTRIRLEAVDACELRRKARLGDVDWPCGQWQSGGAHLARCSRRSSAGRRVCSQEEGIGRNATSMERTWLRVSGRGCMPWLCQSTRTRRSAMLRSRRRRRLRAQDSGRVNS